MFNSNLKSYSGLLEQLEQDKKNYFAAMDKAEQQMIIVKNQWDAFRKRFYTPED